MDCMHKHAVVEEHCVVGRSMIERTCGRGTRENAGISSESKVRIFTVESLRVPEEGSSTQGKSGPKVRPKGVADGHQVKIPELPTSDKDFVWGRRSVVQACKRKSTSRKGERRLVAKWVKHTDEKSHMKVTEVPVLQTDTGRRGEEPKTSERNVVKELGKLTP